MMKRNEKSTFVYTNAQKNCKKSKEQHQTHVEKKHDRIYDEILGEFFRY